MKIYFIILLICVVLLTVLYLLNSKKEGFASDYSDFSTIDRIKTPQGYSYCLAGNITCPSGNLVNLKDNYGGGTTYNYLCDNYGQAQCNNFASKLPTNQLNWSTPTAREVSFPFSDVYKGFSIPYDNYIPVDITDKYINFYDSSDNILDNINKCELLNTRQETDKCLESLKPKKKCIANYGTKIGEPLCCGQKGVLQKSASDYVCLPDAPNCAGYLCGKTYGNCTS